MLWYEDDDIGENGDFKITLIDGDYDDDNDNSEDDIHAIHFISPKRIFKNMESRDDGDEDDDIDAIA